MRAEDPSESNLPLKSAIICDTAHDEYSLVVLTVENSVINDGIKSGDLIAGDDDTDDLCVRGDGWVVGWTYSGPSSSQLSFLVEAKDDVISKTGGEACY